jgi:hypothetical protein
MLRHLRCFTPARQENRVQLQFVFRRLRLVGVIDAEPVLDEQHLAAR